tara:strand:+ start:2715 stop:3044 length:330 start_codon:yes stop_codon:yes gene_type:complete
MPDRKVKYKRKKEMHPRDPSMIVRYPSMVSQKGTGSTASKGRMENLVKSFSTPGDKILKGKSPFPKTEPGSPRLRNLEKSHKQLQEAKSKLKPAVSFFRDRQVRNVLKK